MELITFTEHFEDNVNKWWTGNNEEANLQIANSHYYIEHKRTYNDYVSYRYLYIVESKAYSIEASFTFLKGNHDNGFGFLWGQKTNKDSDNSYAGFHYFIINANGRYAIRSYSPQTKKAESIKDWTDSTFIKTGENATNLLKIIKFDDAIDNQLYFLINEQMIFSTDYLHLFGFETGFITFQNIKISIDFFKAIFYFDETLINK